jgi:NADPH-dependent 2,4-dienoyl-CoA reductase/sulfur reductase-like enzyme
MRFATPCCLRWVNRSSDSRTRINAVITGILKTVAFCVTIPCLSLEEDGQLIVELSNGRRIPGDMVVLVAGVMPESIFARRAGLEVGSRRGIRVNPYMQTSDSDIYAVGDAVETKDRVSGLTALVPLAGPANRQGRIAADHICGRPSRYRGTLGTP